MACRRAGGQWPEANNAHVHGTCVHAGPASCEDPRYGDYTHMSGKAKAAGGLNGLW